MNTTTGQLHTLQDALELLAASLVLQRRADGTEYRTLAENAPRRDELQDVVRQCHRGEVPNDWRYETLYDLCHRLLDGSQPDCETWEIDDYRDALPEASDSLTSPYSGALLQWLADCPERAKFEEECCNPGRTDILALAAMRQCEEIALMGEELLNGLAVMVESGR
jgi:hypothetical protein